MSVPLLSFHTLTDKNISCCRIFTSAQHEVLVSVLPAKVCFSVLTVSMKSKWVCRPSWNSSLNPNLEPLGLFRSYPHFCSTSMVKMQHDTRPNTSAVSMEMNWHSWASDSIHSIHICMCVWHKHSGAERRNTNGDIKSSLLFNLTEKKIKPDFFVSVWMFHVGIHRAVVMRVSWTLQTTWIILLKKTIFIMLMNWFIRYQTSVNTQGSMNH